MFLKFETSPSWDRKTSLPWSSTLGKRWNKNQCNLTNLTYLKHTRMSCWKLGSMVRKWVISSLSMEYIGVVHVAPLKLISCWWFRNPVTNWGWSFIPLFTTGLSTIPGGCLGFLPATVCLGEQSWDSLDYWPAWFCSCTDMCHVMQMNQQMFSNITSTRTLPDFTDNFVKVKWSKYTFRIERKLII